MPGHVGAPVPACDPDTTTSSPGSPRSSSLGVEPQGRGQELLAQPLLPAAVGQLLLRGLGGEAGYEAFLGGHRCAAA